MAEVANSAEKCVDLTDMECSNPMTAIDDSPSAAKKLKQARLPFKPLGPKTQMPLTPHGIPKKRKLSDQESPSAKAAKVISKHQTERMKLDVPDKTQSDIQDHENEVSSSSEAENIPLGTLQKRKVSETNILERFVRKSSQEEISSTNEVVDLTDDGEGTTNPDSALTTIVDGASTKSVKLEGESKVDDDIVLVEEPRSAESAESSKKVTPGKISKVEAIASGGSDKARRAEPSKHKTESTDDELVTKTICNKLCSKEERKIAEKTEVVVVDTDVEMISEETSQAVKTTNGEEKPAVEETDLEVSVMSNKSKCTDKSSDVDTSVSSGKSKSDEESSTSSSEESDNEKDNDSLGDVSVSPQGNSSSANTSVCKTPKNKVPSVTKTPGGSSVQTSTPKNTRGRPKSLKMSEIKSQEKKKEREATRQRIREQKEQEQQERKEKKEQEKLDAKKKKDEEKAEKERKKTEEKEKKERERQEKKEQLDREKMEKQQQKEEEKKKKQDVIDAKMEEKKKKEEEKRLKEEEKLKEEEEKNKKKIKEKQSFTNFFIKKTLQQSKPKEASQFFTPFEVKKDMFLAPPQRRQLGEDAKSTVDQYLLEQECGCLYIEEIKKSSYQKGKSPRTLPRKVDSPPELEEDDDVKCIDGNEEKKKDLVQQHCKLLQFHKNYRPPYYGTWRKTSKIIKPTKPFNQDTDLFDYEVDSDDEWEEEEPGESVSSSEDEGEEKDEEAEDEDGWMVPHGYLSEDEGCDQDEEITPEVLKARQMAKQEAWEADQKRQKHPMRAIVIGCVWEGDKVVEKLAAKLAEFQAVCLSAVPIDTRSRITDSGSVGGKEGDKSSLGKGNRKPVPEEAMADLIHLLHGNTIGIKKLIKEFRLYWKKKTSNSLGDADGEITETDVSMTDKNASALDESCTDDKSGKGPETDAGSTEGDGGKTEDSADGCGISKRQLEIKIMSIAVREKRADFKKVCWYVHEKVLKQYQLVDLPLPNAWQYVSKGLIRVKNEEACGRRTPNNMSESFTDSVPMIMKEEEESESKPLPKDQPSIMQFARKMQPSELPPPKIRRIELKPTSSTTPSAAEAKKVESPVADLDSSANEEVLAPYKTLPKDQRSIMDFAKKRSPQPPKAAQTKSGIIKKVTPKKPVTTDLINQNLKPGEVTQSKTKKIISPPRVVSSAATSQPSATNIANGEEAMDTDDCIVLD